MLRIRSVVFHHIRLSYIFCGQEKAVVAEGTIRAADGLCGTPNRAGHFAFHEFESAQLWLTFKPLASSLQ